MWTVLTDVESSSTSRWRLDGFGSAGCGPGAAATDGLVNLVLDAEYQVGLALEYLVETPPGPQSGWDMFDLCKAIHRGNS